MGVCAFLFLVPSPNPEGFVCSTFTVEKLVACMVLSQQQAQHKESEVSL